MILAALAGCRHPRALPLLLLGALLSLPGGAPRAAEEEDRGGVDWWGDWIPSVGLGGGLMSRETEGSIGGGVSDFQVGIFGDVTVVEHGVRTDGTDSQLTTCIVGQERDNGALCEFYDESSTSVDGFVLTPSVQVLGPALNPLPMRPRLLFQGGYGFPYVSRTVSAAGFKPVTFDDLGAEPKVRLQLKGDQQYFWWVGGGVALQLPFDRYRTWLKLSASYSEEEIEAVARMDSFFAALGNSPLGSRNVRQTLLIRSISPGIGLEAEVGSIGPVSFSISADTLISIALENDGSDFTDDAGNALLVSPTLGPNVPGGPIEASYQPDDLSVFGILSVRFNWIGFER